MSDRDQKRLSKRSAALLRCVAVVGAMIVALGLFDLSWPYEAAIVAVVMFIVFSFEGLWTGSTNRSKS